MLRRLSVLLLAAALAPAGAAVFPDTLGGFTKQSERSAPVQDGVIWEEFGLEESVVAAYSSQQARFEAAAWRLRDATSALAVFQWRRPGGSRTSALAPLAVETASGLFLAHGNYVFHFQDYKPIEEMLAVLTGQLPRLDVSPLPALPDFLPTRDRVELSERYIVGPASLKAFLPAIPPSLAGFHLGVEIQAARFRTPKGEQTLAVLSYPTPHIARERLLEFRSLPDSVAKRSGPLLAAVLSPLDPDAAQVLLSRVNYQTTITWNESAPGQEINFGDLLITVFTFIGILIGFTVLAGVAFAGVRRLKRKISGQSEEQDPMIMLHIDDR